ncbi:hypothetical protein [Mycobacteroides abscessus]|uniref:hypothetical protein n=1 Tax=Mycobacteroides abscessus TaxID=36809 RepID=UPI0013FD09BC|nr:hypothetical protein [Mycobacteroides abscessus]
MEQYVVRADGGAIKVPVRLGCPVGVVVVARAAAMAGSCDDGDDAAGSEILVGHRA